MAAGTTGSTTVSSMYPILREIAANMREMLRADAAKILGKPVADVQVAAGTLATNKGLSRTYGEMVRQHTGAWDVPKDKPTFKAFAEFKVIGQPMQRVDLPEKIVGEAVYGYDARLPNMLYGAIAIPPTIEGKLSSAAGTAEEKTGVIKVVIEKDFVGVVAESRRGAQRRCCCQIEWDEGKLWHQARLMR